MDEVRPAILDLQVARFTLRSRLAKEHQIAATGFLGLSVRAGKGDGNH